MMNKLYMLFMRTPLAVTIVTLGAGTGKYQPDFPFPGTLYGNGPVIEGFAGRAHLKDNLILRFRR